MTEVAWGTANFAVRVCVPSVQAKPPWGRSGAVDYRKQGCFLGFGGPFAVQKTAYERPVRGLATPISTIGEAAVESGFLDLLETNNDIVPEECGGPVAEVKFSSCMIAEGAWGD
jgi:hypothetical protein